MKILALILSSLFAANALALPVLDRVKVIGKNSEVALIPDHEDSQLFYFGISGYSICEEADGSPKGLVSSDILNGTPFVKVNYTLCPEVSRNAGATKEQVEAVIREFIETTGAKVVPLTPRIQIKPEGLWRVPFDQLEAKVSYECIPDAGLLITCILYGEGGRAYSTKSPERFDARLLYDLYVRSSFALNGYFYADVTGYVQAKPDAPDLVKIERHVSMAFWAQPDFGAYPAKMKLNWAPAN